MNYEKPREQWDIHDLVDVVMQGKLCRLNCCKSLVDDYEVVAEPIRPNSKDQVRVKLKYVRKNFRKNQEGHWEDDCLDPNNV